jgi:hypothetical protein
MLQEQIRSKDFSPHLFWDIALETLDLDRHAPYVIDRVLSLGTMEDFRKIKSYYGIEKIKQVVKDARYLDDKVLHFCSLYFNIPLPDFRCYTHRPLTTSHWQY